ncbi:MAG: M1 family aminopeptidase [Candidatus Eisenbacteria bacterium]
MEARSLVRTLRSRSGRCSLLFVWSVVWMVGCFPMARAARADDPPADSPYEKLRSEVRGLEDEPVVVADVAQFPFQRECATFVLQQGRLYLFPELADGRHVAFFEGEGRFLFAPPIDLERTHLQRVLDHDQIDTGFQHLLLFFADRTAAQLRQAFAFAPGELSKDDQKFLHTTATLILDSPGDALPTGMATAVLNGDENDYFYASLDAADIGHLCVEVDPYRPEEVRLQKRIHTIGATIGRKLELISLFHRGLDYQLGHQDDYGSNDRVRAVHNQLHVALDGGLDMDARADLTLESRVDSLRWFHLELHPSLDVDSISWSDGRAASFWRGEDADELWISARPPLAAGERAQLRVVYHGDVLDRTGDWIALKSSLYWYPRPLSNERATFDVTYEVPQQFTLASAGKKTSEETRGDLQVSRWEMPVPSHNFSFSVGFFKLFTIEDERIPPVAVYMSKSHHRDIGEALIEEGVTSGRGMEKQVGADVANAIAFFQHVYGPCPAEHLRAVELPKSHGEAFPGLLQLSWVTFQTDQDDEFNELFRAHEVAHQWWGYGVDNNSYHDKWLSEGFAEYSGLWFMQNQAGDNDLFFRYLRDWRDRIFDNREYTIGRGRDAGPIWLGYRTGSSATPGDYDLIIYEKGAWVLHMLRNMLLDLDTMSEDKFIDLMRDFYDRYKGRDATTADFQSVVSEHFGMDMSWFFDQWVLRTAVPTYEYAYRITASSNGRYSVALQVAQLDVPEDFRVYMPVYVDFGEGRFARVRVVLTGAHSQFDLPPMSLKPREIRLNDMESVLCRVKQVDWKEGAASAK